MTDKWKWITIVFFLVLIGFEMQKNAIEKTEMEFSNLEKSQTEKVTYNVSLIDFVANFSADESSVHQTQWIGEGNN